MQLIKVKIRLVFYKKLPALNLIALPGLQSLNKPKKDLSACVCTPATDDNNIICVCLEAQKHGALIVQNLVIFHSLRPTFFMGFKLMWGPNT